MPRFDTEWTTATRCVLALTIIIAVVALSVGIKDYLQQKKANPAASTSSPSVVQAENAKTGRKRIRLAKTTRTPMSGTEAKASAAVQAGADPMDKPLISETFPKGRAKTTGAIDNAPNTLKGQSGHDALEAAMDREAMDRNNRMRKQFDMMTTCVPLPNGTQPRDADANYYKNWAREYSCVF